MIKHVRKTMDDCSTILGTLLFNMLVIYGFGIKIVNKYYPNNQNSNR